MLHKLIAKRFNLRVSKIINTHYHYDHTQGNVEYPEAEIYAYRNVPDLMRKRDGDWWATRSAAMPTNLVDDTGTIDVGSQKLALFHPGPAHTQGDLYIVLRRDGKDIVVTGDIVFNTYYPMMDMGE